MNVEFFRSAIEELIEAADSYERDVLGLGCKLMLDVERVAALIGEFPSLGERLDKVHRRIPLRRFPYALIFRHEGEIVRVVAIAHRRRRPRYWSGRVHDRDTGTRWSLGEVVTTSRGAQGSMKLDLPPTLNKALARTLSARMVRKLEGATLVVRGDAGCRSATSIPPGSPRR